MAQIPEYQVETRDIDTFQTRNTGGHADAADFDPLKDMGSVVSGIDDLAQVANRSQAKEDMMWAQSRYATSQVQWLENVKNYTDPDKFTEDAQNFTNKMIASAPTGRAGDFFLSHMNTLVPRLTRRVLLNQAKQQVDQNTSDFNSAATSVAQVATGQPTLPQEAVVTPDGSSPAPAPLIAPKLGTVDLRALPAQLDQLATNAKGIVPQGQINVTISSAKQQIGKGIIQAATLEDGPGAIADRLEHNADDVMPPDVQPDPQTLKGIINDLRTQHSTNIAVAGKNANDMMVRDLQAIDNGNPPDTATLQSHAEMFGTIMGGKGNKKDDAQQISYLSRMSGAQDAFNLKTGLLGLPPDKAQKALDDFNVANYDDPHATAMGNQAFSKVMTQLQSSPADYTMNSPTMKQNYDAAYSEMTAGWNDPQKAPMANVGFQHTLDQMAAMQLSAGLTKSQVAVMPKDTAIQFASQLQNLPNDQAVTMLGKLADSYGDYWPNAMRDMTKHGNLPAQFVAMASFRDSPYEGTILNAIKGEQPGKGADSFDKILGMEGESSATKANLKSSVFAGMKDYIGTVGWNNGGAQGASQISDLVSSVAKYHMATGGMEMQPAVNQAVDEVIHSQFNVGTANARTYLIPKAEVPDGEEGMIRDGAKAMLPLIGKGALLAPDIGATMGKPDNQLTQDDRDEFQQAVSRYGTWINTPDGKGLRLVIDQQKVAAALNTKLPVANNIAGTGLSNVTSGGKPIEVPFNAIKMFTDWNTRGEKNRSSVPPLGTKGYDFTPEVDDASSAY